MVTQMKIVDIQLQPEAMATTATHRFDQYETTKMLASQRHPYKSYKLMACETSLNMPFSATSSKSP